ncbi:MAG: von Willebrand factor type A domain-containing protein [Planctomycetes bacterium]|nr:von Willebrand factor type A domain-containing protein [Planctomycetota bacterium]
MTANHDAPLTPHPDCASFQDELTHLVLGELPAERVAAVEAHCATCAACAAERELLAKSAQLLAADAATTAPVLQLSSARQEALLTAAAQSAPLAPVRRFWNARRSLAAAAAIALVAIGGQWLWRGYDVGATRSPAEATTLASLQEEDRAEASRLGYPVGSGSFPFGTADGVWANGPGAQSSTRATQLTARGASPSALLPSDGASAGAPSSEAAPARSRGEAEAGTRESIRNLDSLKALGYLGSSDEDGAAAVVEEQLSDLTEASGATVLHVRRLPAADDQLAPSGVERRRQLALGEAEQLAQGEAKKLEELGYVAPGPVVGFGQSQTVFLEEDLATLSLWTEFNSEIAQGAALGLPLETVESRNRELMDDVQPAPHFFRDSSDGDIRGRTEVFFDAKDESAPAGDSYGLDRLSALSSALTLGRRQSDAAVVAALAQLATLAPSELVALESSLAPAASGRTLDVDGVVKRFLEQLAPRQGEPPRDMFFRWFGDHPFVPTRIDTLSTFGMDVDTASYNLARAYLEKGTLPPKAAVRTEEFVNAFRHGLAAPPSGATLDGPAADGTANDVFAITTELAPSPFGGEGRHLLRVGLKAREIGKESRKPAALTFVLDVSGSMEEGGRLELVKQSLRLLVAQLDERDTIGIVAFSDTARRALPPTRASDARTILAVLDSFRPEQSTNADAGLRLGYEMAVEQLRADADNRVILCSDGVANTGVTDPAWLSARIRECKSRRIYLTSIGVGMNNHNDALMEQLADEGDGQCHYVDDLAEAKEIFVDRMTGTLSTVARDAKIQVEFDPRSVRTFRQLGYENRAIAHANFRNDRVDAGEVGAGHEVVALYELELAPDAAGPLATVRCRYEDPRLGTVREQARLAFAAEAGASAGAMAPRWRLAAAVAEFAELLRQSVHARDGSFGAVLRLAEPLVAELPEDRDVAEFVALVQQAARLPDLLPRRTPLTRCVDEIKKVRCWQEELKRAEPSPQGAPQQEANRGLMEQLEEQNRKLEQALRDALAAAAAAR